MDAELRRELLARRDEDQRVRTMVPMSRGQHMMVLSDDQAAEWERVDQDNTRWLGAVVAGVARPSRQARLRRRIRPTWKTGCG